MGFRNLARKINVICGTKIFKPIFSKKVVSLKNQGNYTFKN